MPRKNNRKRVIIVNGNYIQVKYKCKICWICKCPLLYFFSIYFRALTNSTNLQRCCLKSYFLFVKNIYKKSRLCSLNAIDLKEDWLNLLICLLLKQLTNLIHVYVAVICKIDKKDWAWNHSFNQLLILGQIRIILVPDKDYWEHKLCLV